MKSSSSLKHLVLCVLGLIAFQTASRFLPGNDRNYQPGVVGEDWDAPVDVLPEDIHGWVRTSYTPGSPTDELPEGQSWWTHQWTYAHTELRVAARVAMDQATFRGWHELTQCYQGNGWTLGNRSVDVRSNAKGWPLVVAELSKQPNESGILVFSLFYEDGEPVFPVEYGLIDQPATDLTGRLLNRKRNAIKGKKSETRRSIQCQTLAVRSNSHSKLQIEAIVQLHIDSRGRLKQGWLDATSPNN